MGLRTPFSWGHSFDVTDISIVTSSKFISIHLEPTKIKSLFLLSKKSKCAIDSKGFAETEVLLLDDESDVFFENDFFEEQ